jgi:hypothetical protein
LLHASWAPPFTIPTVASMKMQVCCDHIPEAWLSISDAAHTQHNIRSIHHSMELVRV